MRNIEDCTLPDEGKKKKKKNHSDAWRLTVEYFIEYLFTYANYE